MDKFLIRKGPFYCQGHYKWIYNEAPPTDALAVRGTDLCDKCKQKKRTKKGKRGKQT